MWAVAGCHTAAAALLLERQAVADAIDADGRTALMLAAEAGHTDGVRLAMQFGRGGLDEADQIYGRTALMWGVSAGKTEVVQLLLASGAHVDADDAAAAAAVAKLS
eukprot:TRINITY_DN5753_c0_g1_i2.p3 TRINITY_DN5753_c0_g1~~TRINITY_DN5753_c0_g1_i2.p3  ORF type:complete len:106 (-),score=32.53 TRINITY_DN5753_c0_g1_i2:263-580(-)